MRSRELAEQVDDLGLDRHVERGHAFVGDDQPRVDRERPGDPGALALAAAHAARRRAAKPGRAPTRSSSSPTAPGMSAGAALALRTASTSARVWPTVSRGLSALTGPGRPSPPRGAGAAERLRRSRCEVAPSKATWPAVTRVRPRTARASVLLPLPDSPTMPTVSPGQTRRLTPVSARNSRRRVPEAAAAGKRHLEIVDRRASARRSWAGGVAAAAPGSASDGWLAMQRPRVGVARRGEDRAVARLDHPAVPHHRDAVAGLGDHAEVVGDQQDRQAAPVAQVVSRRSICACIVTSSAVVGSSAIRISGSQASATAIIARWRMPPENSCG